MACANQSGAPLLEKAASAFSAVPQQVDVAHAGIGLQYEPVRDPAFAPRGNGGFCPKLVADCGKRLLALAVVVAVGVTMVNVAMKIFRKPRGGAS